MASLFTLALSLAAAVASTPLSTNSFDTPSQRLTLAPLLAEGHRYGSINNSYIVMLKKDTPTYVVQNHLNFLQLAHATDDDGFTIKHFYNHVKGYAGHFSEKVVDQVRAMPEVDYVERDQIVRTQDVQKSAPWGLARISHRPKLRLSTFNRYEYDSRGGEGVDVYVIDTGINIDHVEFEGRAIWGKTILQDDVDEDGNGHGTHCAGTIASRKYGVAKAANVIAVKVLGSNGSGPMSDAIAGVEFAVESAVAKAKAAEAEFKATGKTAHKGSVVNMSLGGGKSHALDRTVDAAVDTGLHFAVAAGNDDRDACDYSPAAAEKVVTVGASTIGDERAYFSNHGKCVDLFGPGLGVLSTYMGGKDATETLSGTSMASPHVAGLLAYFLSLHCETFYPALKEDPFDFPSLEQHTFSGYAVVHAALPPFITRFFPAPRFVDAFVAPTAKCHTITPHQLKKALLELATKDMLSDLPPHTPNLLVFNNATVS
ncbi:peptidase S8/S53 domain-containing protein [Mycena rebaudengoi]|nr:peptidase S8/S53 domain-containing protein [Mycena rebaudengoi]